MTDDGDRCDVDDVIITDELDRRPSRPADYEAENKALHDLAETLAAEPGKLFQRLVEAAAALTRSDAAGIGLLEPGGLFRPAAATGDDDHGFGYASNEEASPCGEVIARDRLLLFSGPERAFPTLANARPAIAEALAAPFHIGGKAAGAFWAVRHDPEAPFDREDARVLLGVARFASSAHQAALGTSEAKYRTLFETMGQGYCDLELLRDASGRAFDQRYLELNPAYERLIGIPVADAKGRTASQVMPDLEPWWTETFDRIAKRGEPERIEHQVASLGRWYEVLVYPRGDDRLTVLYEDITDRKSAETALRTSEERQAYLLKLSDALRPLADPAAIQATAMQVLGEQLHLTRSQYYEAEPNGEWLISAGGYTDGAAPITDRVRMDDFGTYVKEAFRAGRTLAVADVAQDPRVSKDELASYDGLGFRAFVGIPLVKDGRFVASLGLHQATARQWSETDLGLAEETAERTWAAVERARAETALRESKERFRLIVENATAYAIFVTDPSGIIIDWLAGAEAVFGWTAEEAIGRDAGITFTPEDQAEQVPEKEIETAAQKGCAPDIRWHQRKDGGHVFIEGTVTPLYDDGRNIRGYVKIGHDVSERRNAQEALEASERRMRSLATGIPQLVFRSMGDGYRTWGSPQWIEFTGLSFEESLGFGWVDAVHPDEREMTRAAWDDARERGEYYVEHRVLHAASGDYLWHQTRATPLRDEEGRILEWLGTSSEVEELRQLQRHQSVLLAELQHRVRNTLAVIRSIARRTAATSGNVTEMAMHLEGRIGAFSRVQAAVTRNPEAGVDLAALIEDELLAHAAREGMNLKIDGSDVSLKPRAAESLSLGIHELATNAVKYGALSVEAGRIGVRWDRKALDGAETLELVWEESGLELEPGGHRGDGFGLELLRRTLPYDLQAQTHLEFRREGLRFRMTMPLGPNVLAD